MSATVTQVKFDPVYTLSLKRNSIKEYLNSIRALFDIDMQEAIDYAISQPDEKLALMGVLMHVVRPQMEEREELFDIEEEILELIDDPDYVKEMEQLEEDRRLIEAMAKGSKAGLLDGRRKLAAEAKDLVLCLDRGLKELKEDISKFHQTRTESIERTTLRIRELSKVEAELLEKTKSEIDSSMAAGRELISLQSRTKDALDKMGDLMWKI